ncbi:MAG: tripartite tricarboxylate transporter TctB family protein [Rhodospirillales bacterium]|nr:tripartite tricarboxylate transporter TctB family protein [Alphaproteobacteria bacterium]MBL6928655.1 tripartite tricarboxylate transporter TctB family protein [Rhodospirillales bacterium]
MSAHTSDAPGDTAQRRFVGNLLIPIVLLALIAVYFFETLEYPAQEDVGPAAVPYLWMVFTIGFCVFLAIRAFRGKGKPDPVPGRIGFVALSVVWLSLYLFAIQTVGYFVSTFVFLVVSTYALTYRKLWVIFALATSWMVFSYFIFFKLLYIPLPIGPLLEPYLGY